MSKFVVVKGAQSDTALTTKVTSGSPYQLDPAQVERAAKGLLGHMKKHAILKAESADKKNLLAADDGDSEEDDAPIYLTLSTKTHVKDENRLKPNKIPLFHSIQPKNVRICLIVREPQREFKDLIADSSFPENVSAKICRVIDVNKLRTKYKSFEQKRQLLVEYDVFLADDRIITTLPKVLGKVFYSSKGKRPMPVTVTRQKKGTKTRVTATPQEVAQDIETTLISTLVNLSSSANTTVKIGTLSMTPQQVSQNVGAVVSHLTTRLIPKGWRNVRALHIKGGSTMALPVWLADELWLDERQVLDQPWTPPIRDGAPRINEKKRKFEEWENELIDEEELAERRSRSKKSDKMKAINVTPKEKASISKERKKKIKNEAMKSVQAPLIAS